MLPPSAAIQTQHPAPRRNNFDALRLTGALLVAISHTIAIFCAKPDPLAAASGVQSLGGIGLNVFCVISGYLVTRSRANHALAEFAKARALRILPALMVAVAVFALVMGPAVTSLPVAEYFQRGEVLRFLASGLVLPLNQTLPGVFGGFGFTGQLYSLTAEVLFYVFVGILGGRRHSGWLFGIALVGVASIFLRNDYASMPFSHVTVMKVGDLVWLYFPQRLQWTCFYYLFAGSLLAGIGIENNPIRKGLPLFLALWAIALTVSDRRVYDMAEYLLFPLIVLIIGTSRRFALPLSPVLGDISYGTYIYHVAVIHLMQFVFPASSWIGAGLCVLISTLVGWLSFHLVEKHFLAMAKTSRRSAASNLPAENAGALKFATETQPTT